MRTRKIIPLLLSTSLIMSQAVFADGMTATDSIEVNTEKVTGILEEQGTPKETVEGLSAYFDALNGLKTYFIGDDGGYEVNVIGMRYNEAMETVDKFIDDALMLGYPSIRIIHGMGTGALRKGVRQLLKRKSFVDHFTDGGPNEGGLGATLVHFK